MIKKCIALALVLLTALVLLCSCNMSNCYAKLEAEQKKEDFLYLFKVLKKNYPLFKVKYRQFGVTWLENEEDYLQRISKTENDKEFYFELTAILQELEDGHTDLVPPFFYDYLAKILTETEDNMSAGRLNYTRKIILSADKSYRYWRRVIKEFNDRHALIFRKNTGNGLIALKRYNSTIYLKLKSFLMSVSDCQTVKQFIINNRDSSNIIIDIRDNSGGRDVQWIENIVDPLLREDVEVKRINAFRGGSLGETYLQMLTFQDENDFVKHRKPIADLPKGLNYPPELATDFNYYYESSSVYEAKENIGFKGDIYLLINNRVYSSAEGLASFCKQVGFATLIGERTKGDGGSFEPAMFQLPSSGLIVRMRLQMTLNQDGTSNAEYGTAPDIAVQSDQALKVALRIIEEKSNAHSVHHILPGKK